MQISYAASLARDMIAQHNLSGWTLEFDGAKNRFGICKYGPKIISLSRHLVVLNDETKVRDVILHEIAHGLVGPGNGHNYIWKAKALDIGARPERCYSNEVVRPEALYVGNCPGCNRQFQKHRMRSKAYSCNYCSGGRFDSRYVIIWNRNK